jgi:hypothetical protein
MFNLDASRQSPNAFFADPSVGQRRFPARHRPVRGILRGWHRTAHQKAIRAIFA